MGFDWHACISTGYAQQVMHINCYSRFATRCLKLANPVGRTRTKKQKTRTKLPGEDLPEPALADRTYEEYPFSDTEEELRPCARNIASYAKKYTCAWTVTTTRKH